MGCARRLLLVEGGCGAVNDFLANDGLRRASLLGCTPALKDLIAEAMSCPTVDGPVQRGELDAKQNPTPGGSGGLKLKSCPHPGLLALACVLSAAPT